MGDKIVLGTVLDVLESKILVAVLLALIVAVLWF